MGVFNFVDDGSLPGCAVLKLSDGRKRSMSLWVEFITASGYLSARKIRSRFQTLVSSKIDFIHSSILEFYWVYVDSDNSKRRRGESLLEGEQLIIIKLVRRQAVMILEDHSSIKLLCGRKINIPALLAEASKASEFSWREAGTLLHNWLPNIESCLKRGSWFFFGPHRRVYHERFDRIVEAQLNADCMILEFAPFFKRNRE